jgi:1,4-alpha-glucan branching enzyme
VGSRGKEHINLRRIQQLEEGRISMLKSIFLSI